MTLRLPTAWPARCSRSFERWVIYSARERERARTSHECEGAFFVRMRILGRTASNTMGPPKLVMSSNANRAELPKLVPCSLARSLCGEWTMHWWTRTMIGKRANRNLIAAANKRTLPYSTSTLSTILRKSQGNSILRGKAFKCGGRGLKMD